MNRWFIAALITLALIVLVSPGIVGRLAEKSVEENLNFAASETDELVVTTESFDRGWFTSEGRHRIELSEGSVRALFEDSLDGQVPSLIVVTRVDHGLLPVTSMSRDSGSLMPGLASTVSTIKLDAGNGEIFEVPGKIYSHVGLTGETTSRFLMEPGSRSVGDATLRWQGADVTVQIKPASGSVSIDGEVLPMSILDEDGGVEFGHMTIEGRQDRSQFGFNVGSARLEVDSVSIKSGDSLETGFSRLAIDANSEIEGEKVNATTKLQISGVPTAALGDIDIAVNIVFNGLDARSFHKITEVVRNAQASTDPQATIAGMYPLIERDLQKLLTSGLEIRIDKFDVTLPSGDVTTKLRFDLPASDPDAVFSWPALLLTLDASADFRLPVELYEIAEMMNPDVGMLVAMGILKKDDDYYQMRAEYAKGLVTVNGAPMPIPLQALQ